MAMTMKELHDWVKARRETNPASANRVTAASNGVPTYWASKLSGFNSTVAVTASLAAMELQRIVELHNEGRNPNLLAA